MRWYYKLWHVLVETAQETSHHNTSHHNTTHHILIGRSKIRRTVPCCNYWKVGKHVKISIRIGGPRTNEGCKEWIESSHGRTRTCWGMNIINNYYRIILESNPIQSSESNQSNQQYISNQSIEWNISNLSNRSNQSIIQSISSNIMRWYYNHNICYNSTLIMPIISTYFYLIFMNKMGHPSTTTSTTKQQWIYGIIMYKTIVITTTSY